LESLGRSQSGTILADSQARMNNTSALLRSLVIYSVCVPLAVMLGYLITTPLDAITIWVVSLVIFILALPLFLRWNHLWLIATWNTTMVFFILPGRPQVWILLAWMCLLTAFLQYILNRNLKFLSVPVLARPLIFLGLVVIVTARFTGGIGIGALGSQIMGGRRYLFIFSAVVGYFALASRRVPAGRQWLYVAIFFLATATQGIGELAPVLGPTFYYIALLFPVEPWTLHTMLGAASTGFIARLSGFSDLSSALFCVVLARYRISEIFGWRSLGRLMLFAGFVVIGMLGGYRSVLIFFGLVFGILFCLEGLVRSRLFPVLLILFILVATVTVPVVDRLPSNIQRTLSFLPVKVDPLVKASAEASTQWRVQMWKEVVQEVPKYLLLGKGLGINSAEMASLTADESIENAELAGDYHSGPLSLIVPFGIFGVIGFVWLMGAGLRVLYRNYQFGDPAFKTMNRFLFAYFIAKLVLFLSVFGGFYSDLMVFTGLLGLSVSLNGGEARKPAMEPQTSPAISHRPLIPRSRPLARA